MTSSKIIKIDNLLDISLHILNELELNIGLKKRTSDFIETLIENFLIHYDGIAHFLEST